MIYWGMTFFLACNIFIGIKYYRLKDSASSIAAKYASLSVKEERISQKLKTYSIYQQTMEGYNIPNVMISNREKDSLALSSLFQNTKDAILCFRFKDTHCDACVQHAMRLLNDAIEKVHIRTVVLCGYTNYVHFAAFESKQKSEISIYNIENIKDWDIDQIEQSYFFIMNGGRVSQVFIPLKEDDEYTQRYISILSHKYGKLRDEHSQH